MLTKVIFHEGLKGSGVVVSVSYGTDRVLFDFGAPFRPNSNVYDGTVKRRIRGALRDALQLKETPGRLLDASFSNGTFSESLIRIHEQKLLPPSLRWASGLQEAHPALQPWHLLHCHIG